MKAEGKGRWDIADFEDGERGPGMIKKMQKTSSSLKKQNKQTKKWHRLFPRAYRRNTNHANTLILA
jgi:hypothetical protein